MKDLATIAQEAAKDHRRAQELQKALTWISQYGAAMQEHGCSVHISTTFASSVPGYDETMGLMASAVRSRVGIHIDEFVAGAREELETIVERYRPLLEQPEAGEP